MRLVLLVCFWLGLVASCDQIATAQITGADRARVVAWRDSLQRQADDLTLLLEASAVPFPDGFPSRRFSFQVDPSALAAALTDGDRFPLVVRFSAAAAAAIESHGPSDGVGLRFANSAGEELPFQRVDHASAAEAIYRVGVVDPDPDETYYVYYDDVTTTEWEDTAACWEAFRAAYDFGTPPTGNLGCLTGSAQNSLTPSGGITHIDGAIHKAWQFSGATGTSANGASGTLADYGRPLTWEVIGKWNVVASSKGLLFIDTGFFNQLSANASGNAQVQYVFPGALYVVTSSTAVGTGIHCWTVTCDAAQCKLYRDGVLIAQAAPFPIGSPTTPTLRVGYNSAVEVSEVRLSESLRSEAWITLASKNALQTDAALVWGSEETAASMRSWGIQSGGQLSGREGGGM